MSDKPRFLHPHATAGSRDYVTQPLREIHDDSPEMRERIGEAKTLRDEPEAISGAWVDAITELAAKYQRMRLLKEHEEKCRDRKVLDITHRLLDVRRRAKAQRVDASHELHIICNMLKRAPAQAIARLERLEARLDGVSEERAA